MFHFSKTSLMLETHLWKVDCLRPWTWLESSTSKENGPLKKKHKINVACVMLCFLIFHIQKQWKNVYWRSFSYQEVSNMWHKWGENNHRVVVDLRFSDNIKSTWHQGKICEQKYVAQWVMAHEMNIAAKRLISNIIIIST